QNLFFIGVSSGATFSSDSFGSSVGAKMFFAVADGIKNSPAEKTCAPDLEIDATNTPAIIASPSLVRFSTLDRFTGTSPTACETFYLRHRLEQPAPFFFYSYPRIYGALD